MTSTVAAVNARNGTRLQTRSWPVDGTPRASVLIVHGLAEHSGRYERTGGILAAAGFAVPRASTSRATAGRAAGAPG